MIKSLKEILQYRELLKTSVRKDIRGRYKGSFLGILWTFINPLLQVLVYYLVFPVLMRGSMENYVVYLICGLFPWTYFQGSVLGGVNVIKGNAGIIKKVYFPRQILVLSQVLSGLINFLICIPIILIFVVIFQIPLSWNVLWVPFIALIQSVLIYGIDLFLSAINVYVQDMEHIVNFILQMLMYGTPIIYDLNQFAGGNPVLFNLIKYNPLTLLVTAYRNCFMYQSMPSFKALGAVLLLAIVLVVAGTYFFDRMQRGFAEEL